MLREIPVRVLNKRGLFSSCKDQIVCLPSLATDYLRVASSSRKYNTCVVDALEKDRHLDEELGFGNCRGSGKRELQRKWERPRHSSGLLSLGQSVSLSYGYQR